jgi:Tfp pilus assembly protein PilW
MRHPHFNATTAAAFTLVETMISMAIGTFVIGGLLTGAIAVRKSIDGTERYVTGINNTTRLMDYVVQDLRRAVRVGKLVGATNTPYKNDTTGFSVTTTNILTINIPDYYGSNTPDNSLGSSFKSSRYNRTNLDSGSAYWVATNSLLNGTVPWAEAATTIGSAPAVRYAPAATSNGEIQVRYYRGPRSASDSSVCYFRAEYPSASNTPNNIREVAEKISDNISTTTLTTFVTTPASGRSVFRVQSGFTPRYSIFPSTSGTREVVGVTSRNQRRD